MESAEKEFISLRQPSTRREVVRRDTFHHVFRQIEADPKSLGHKVTFTRRRHATTRCIFMVIVLLLLLIGTAVAIYFIVQRKYTKQEIKDDSTLYSKMAQVEITLVDMTYTQAYLQPDSTEYKLLEGELLRLFGDIGSKSRLQYKDIYIVKFKQGSVIPVFVYKFNISYTRGAIEDETKRIILSNVQINPTTNRFTIGRFAVNLNSLKVSAISNDDEHDSGLRPGVPAATSSTISSLTSTKYTTLSNQRDERSGNSSVTTPSSNDTANSITTVRQSPSAIITTKDSFTQTASTVPPPVYDIRIIDGVVDGEGTVQVYIDGQWGFVCDDNWSTEDATVVCNQLGIKKGKVTSRINNYFYSSHSLSVLGLVICSGTETNLGSCKHTQRTNCDKNSYVGVSCSDIVNKDEQFPVRLVSGVYPWEGRVEILFRQKWGTICGYGFGLLETSVVCRSLGYNNSAFYDYTQNFGPGTDEIWLENVECKGHETRIEDCILHQGWGKRLCSHQYDIGVVCSAPAVDTTEVQITTGRSTIEILVRLSDGPDELSGRLEVNYNGEWGTVCNTLFDDNAAAVFCRMMGFTGSARYVRRRFGPGEGPIWLNGVQCKGDELSVLDCLHAGWTENVCTHYSDVSITCENS